MRRIKIAHIGMNFYSHASQCVTSLKKQSDIFEVAGYCLPENEREKYPGQMKYLEGLKELTLDEVMNDPTVEAVTVETDEIHLTKYATLAAQHKKHIHMEKPGGCVLSEFEKLTDILRKNDTVFHTGYMYRYNPYITDAIKRARAGELGEIISVEAQMSCTHRPDVRKWLNTFPGGMMFFLGCHLIDIILQIQGEPKKIIPLNRHTCVGGIDSPDYGMAVLDYGNGISFAKTTDMEIGGFSRRQVVITGSKATIEINPLEVLTDTPLIFTEKTERTELDWHDRGQHFRTETFDRYDGMLRAFAEMVRGEKVNPYTLDYELMLYKTILKCCEEEKK